jgi:hypothetical protein
MLPDELDSPPPGRVSRCPGRCRNPFMDENRKNRKKRRTETNLRIKTDRGLTKQPDLSIMGIIS